MILDIFFYVLVYIGFGVVPLYLIMHRYPLKKRSIVILAFGFAPVSLSILNIIIVFFEIQGTAIAYLIPVLVNVILFLYLKKKEDNYSNLLKIKGLIFPIGAGLLAGIVYWYVGFSNYLAQGVFNPDVVWNLGFINELKNHFPPKDPHWYNDIYFIYHYLSNLYFASISNFTGINIISIMHIGNFFTTLLIFILIALSANKNEVILNVFLFVAALLLNFANDWMPYVSFYSHIGGRATTFYWSLPILFSSIHAWYLLDKKRVKIDKLNMFMLVFLLMLVLFFAKSSYLVVLVFLELGVFLKYFITERLWNFYRIKVKFLTILSFTFYPVSTGIILWIFNTNEQFMFFGITTLDFANFKSWNPIFPFLVIYLVPLILLLIEFKNIKNVKWEFLLASFLNTVLFFVLKHEGTSDLYFMFNAFILNGLFVVFSKMDRKLLKITGAYILGGIFFFFGKSEINGVNSLRFEVGKFSNQKVYGDSLYTIETSELMKLSELLSNNALIAVPKKKIKYFLYSAFLGKRIWNESNTYAHTTINLYLPIRSFLKNTSFIPEYINEVPNVADYTEALHNFKEGFVVDSLKYENSELRHSLYSKCVFGDISLREYQTIVETNNWTHILVENKDLGKINDWVKELDMIESENITLFICN